MMNYDNKCYCLNTAVKFFPFSTPDKILCQLFQPDGQLVASYTLPHFVQQLLEMFDGKSTVAQISMQLSQYDKDKLQQLVDDFLLPQQILLDVSASFRPKSSAKPAYMLFQLPLLNSRLTRVCSSWLSPLFNPLLAWPATLITVLTFCFVILTLLLQPELLPTEPISSVAAIHTVLLIFLALLCHELGHAAAAIRFGCSHVQLGVGGYLCFFIFYADLSESWRLTKRQRLIVDLAGSYLQGLLATAYLCCYFIWQYQPFLAAFTLLNLYTLYNLNPFFRMDGYWIASDILAIPNLRQRSNQLLRQFLYHPLHSYQNYRWPSMPSALAIYTFFMVVFSAFFTYLVIFSLTPMTIARLTSISQQLLVANAAEHSADLLVIYTRLLWQCIMAVFLLLFYFLLLRKLLGLIRIRPQATKVH